MASAPLILASSSDSPLFRLMGQVSDFYYSEQAGPVLEQNTSIVMHAALRRFDPDVYSRTTGDLIHSHTATGHPSFLTPGELHMKERRLARLPEVEVPDYPHVVPAFRIIADRTEVEDRIIRNWQTLRPRIAKEAGKEPLMSPHIQRPSPYFQAFYGLKMFLCPFTRVPTYFSQVRIVPTIA